MLVNDDDVTSLQILDSINMWNIDGCIDLVDDKI